MEATATTPPTSEYTARHTVGRELARLANHGCGQFRVRWFPMDDRVKFEGERENRWHSLADADLRGEQAARIAAVLETIHNKRNRTVEVSCHRKPDHVEYEIRVPVDVLRTHGSQLAGFLESQLFWD